ncbi:MAG: isopentenyl-diphosphate Delta-isomerase [Candidatus Aenigmatarchaeota archaeon]
MSEFVILVDKNDKEIGTMEKIEAHKKAKLHRAFSIFIFNSKNEMLIQKRAKTKYHCGGLWSNTCCSHPRPGETIENATHRKLKQEMGFDCELKEIFSFIYKAKFDNGLTEYEFDHVFIGKYESEIIPNKNEIDDWKFISIKELLKDVKNHPKKYTPWFKKVLKKVITYIKQN